MNLFKKATAGVALVALVSGVFTTGASAYSTAEVEAANMLASKGIINTQADVANYNLGQNVLRQEIAKVSAVMAGIEAKTSCDNSFADVTATTPNTWACSYVEALLDAGKVSANETFRPEDNISKSEAVKMVLEAAGYTGIYTDAAKWQEEVVAFAEENGVTSSFTNYNTPATRGFIFEAAANAVSNTEEDDSDDILGDILGDLDEDETNEGNTDEPETPVVSGDNVLAVELSPETPTNGVVAAETPRTAVLAFDVTAGSEDVTLDEARLDYTGLSSYTAIDKVKMYIGNKQVSKGSGRDFSDKYIELSFENDTVVKAGETVTVVVTSEVQETNNASHQITLTDLEASTDVEMNSIKGMTFSVVSVSNVAELKLSIDEVTGSEIIIGEVIKLADFDLEERNDNEDVVVKSMTFKLGGSMDHQDDISDIVLYVDGEEVSSDLYVNDDEEIIANLDYTIAADEKVNVELKAIVTGSVASSLSAVISEIYAVGAETGINSKLDTNGDAIGSSVAASRNIEGSEINVSFDRSDIDEAKPDAEEVNVGNLVLSTDGEYNLQRVEVKVKSTASSATGVTNVINKLELDGKGFDTLSAGALENATAIATAPLSNDTEVFYYFEDISLNNETLELPLTFDVADNVNLDGQNLEFTVKLVAIEDEDNNEKYDVEATDNSDVDGILSTNALTTADIDLTTASITFTSTKINTKTLVLGNGVETIVYKGKINVGDSDDVTLSDLNFVANGANTLSTGFNKVIDSATLKIGNKTFDADIDSDSLDFNVNAEIAAGSDNVEVLVSVVFKDDGANHTNEVVALQVKTADLSTDLEDSDGNAVQNINIDNINNNIATTKLLTRGKLTIKVLDDVDTDDNLENTVLAGDDSVTLAELEIEAEYEDVKVKELAFTITGTTDFSTTLEDVRLVSGSKVLAEGAVVTFSGSTIITFEDDFIVSDVDNLINAELVADLNNITGAGDQSTAVSDDIVVELTAANVEAKGYSSNDELTTANSGLVVQDQGGETISIVPTMLTFAVADSLSTGTAKLKVIADSGNNTVGANDQTPEIEITGLNFSTQGNYNVFSVYNSSNPETFATGAVNTAFASLAQDSKVFDGDKTENFEFSPLNDTASSQTYKLILGGAAATYKVRDNEGNYLQNDGTFATSGVNDKEFTLTLDDSLNFGTTSINK